MQGDLEALRAEADELIDAEKFGFRSCWVCNVAHEHLRDADYPFLCNTCGRWFYRGVDITIYDADDN